MYLDFCTISGGLWAAIAGISVLLGALFGYALQILFRAAGFRISSSRAQNFAGGCFLPVLAGLLPAFAIARLMPEDPCGGAFTADAIFVPLIVFPLVTGAAFELF